MFNINPTDCDCGGKIWCSKCDCLCSPNEYCHICCPGEVDDGGSDDDDDDDNNDYVDFDNDNLDIGDNVNF